MMRISGLTVPWYGGEITCTVFCGWVHGRLCFFIEPHSQDIFFDRGTYYGCDDDPMRFAFFSKAAHGVSPQEQQTPRRDPLPRLANGADPRHALRDVQVPRSGIPAGMYTIHNFKHQGFGGPEVLWATGLNREAYYFHYDRLRDNFNPFSLNLMKGGIVYSNHVNTVSPITPGKPAMATVALA
jgi:starch synthase